MKNRKHASPTSARSSAQASSLEEILAAPMVFDPLTQFQCCPTSGGAAAAVLCSEEFAKKHGIDKPVYIPAMTMTTDYPSSFEQSMIKMVGYDMAKSGREEGLRAERARSEGRAGHRAPRLLHPERAHHLRGARPLRGRRGRRLIDEDQNTYGGKWVVNPSGGLLSKGHPLGATGLAQCFELD